tara:strand:- start:6447 stop:7115 length:669 start_codon:yes stop_codon:yes gene_type:complete
MNTSSSDSTHDDDPDLFLVLETLQNRFEKERQKIMFLKEYGEGYASDPTAARKRLEKISQMIRTLTNLAYSEIYLLAHSKTQDYRELWHDEAGQLLDDIKDSEIQKSSDKRFGRYFPYANIKNWRRLEGTEKDTFSISLEWRKLSLRGPQGTKKRLRSSTVGVMNKRTYTFSRARFSYAKEWELDLIEEVESSFKQYRKTLHYLSNMKRYLYEIDKSLENYD